MNMGPWFDGLPELVKILLLLISGLTSLCTAGTTLLRQWRWLHSTQMNTITTQEEDELEK